jgi:hypothetical protein
VFNLLMSGGGWATNRDSFTASRVLEYTDETVKAQFCPGGSLDLDAVTRIPALFASETRYDDGQDLARVGRLLRVSRQGRADYQLDYMFDPHIPPIPNSTLEDLARDLGIDRFEFSRTHWAIKEADLFEVLYRSQLTVRPQPRVFRITDGAVDASLIAVMMPFAAEFNTVYGALQRAATDSGMQCKRADDIWSNDHIIQDIVDLVCEASVVICDLTGRNPNVFYEMGMAHTLGKDVIIITQSAQDVPFDVQGIRYIKYLANGEGLGRLATDVAGRLTTLRQRR